MPSPERPLPHGCWRASLAPLRPLVFDKIAGLVEPQAGAPCDIMAAMPFLTGEEGPYETDRLRDEVRRRGSRAVLWRTAGPLSRLICWIQRGERWISG